MRRLACTVLSCLCVFSAPLMAQPEKPAPTPKPTAPATPATPAAPAPAAPVKADMIAEPVFTLLDAGAKEGRRELRMHLTAGATEKMVMRMKMSMDMSMNDQAMPKTAMPTMVIATAAKVEKVEASGDSTCAIEYSEITLADDVEVQPAIRKSMLDSFAKIKGMRMDVVFSDRGFARSCKISGVDDPQLKPMFDSMNQSIQQMTTPLPKEAIGVGARWRVVTTPNFGGIAQTITSTYTLTALTTEGATFNISMTQTAKEQKMDAPNVPEGAEMTIKSLEGSGSGSIGVGFTHVSPVSATLNTKATTDMVMKMSGQEFRIKNAMTMEMTIGDKATDSKK